MIKLSSFVCFCLPSMTFIRFHEDVWEMCTGSMRLQMHSCIYTCIQMDNCLQNLILFFLKPWILSICNNSDPDPFSHNYFKYFKFHSFLKTCGLKCFVLHKRVFRSKMHEFTFADTRINLQNAWIHFINAFIVKKKS